MSEFLLSELEEIIFTYDRKENVLIFSDYSCDMLGIQKEIMDPFSDPVIVSRMYSESIDHIVDRMNLSSDKKECIEIQFMNKPFLLMYQCNEDVVICLIKEKVA